MKKKAITVDESRSMRGVKEGKKEALFSIARVRIPPLKEA